MMHTIYHAIGIKVGCTTNLARRRAYYRSKGIIILRVLEELHDKTDQEAGDIEWQWADRFGYQRGQHFAVSRKAALSLPPERRSEIARATICNTRSHSSERNLEIARMGGRSTAERRTGAAYQRGQCSYCGTETTLAVLARCHNDRCWHRPNRPLYRPLVL
jgi:hypothetical protein